MTTELKVTVGDETLAFLRENFPEGLSDAGKARMAIGIIRFVMDDEIGDLAEFLRAEGLADVEDVDVTEIYVEALKRAILESDDVGLADLSGLAHDDADDT